jgi:predicted outer membrane lipoprotein
MDKIVLLIAGACAFGIWGYLWYRVTKDMPS